MQGSTLVPPAWELGILIVAIAAMAGAFWKLIVFTQQGKNSAEKERQEVTEYVLTTSSKQLDASMRTAEAMHELASAIHQNTETLRQHMSQSIRDHDNLCKQLSASK